MERAELAAAVHYPLGAAWPSEIWGHWAQERGQHPEQKASEPGNKGAV